MPRKCDICYRPRSQKHICSKDKNTYQSASKPLDVVLYYYSKNHCPNLKHVNVKICGASPIWYWHLFHILSCVPSTETVDTPPGLPLIHERAGNTLVFFSPIFNVYPSCIYGHLYPNVFVLQQQLTRIGSLFVSLISLAFAEAHYPCICIRGWSHNTRAAPPMGQWLINQWMPNSTECWWDILSNHLPKDFCNGSMTEYRMLMRHFPAAFWETIVKRFVHCDQRSMTDQRMLIVGTSCSTFPSATIVKTSKRFHQWLLNEW